MSKRRTNARLTANTGTRAVGGPTALHGQDPRRPTPRARPPAQASDTDDGARPSNSAARAGQSDAGRAPVDAPTDDSRSLLEIAGTVIAPFTVITAWFYYFGWVRTSAIFSYFGIDQALLGFTSQEYLLRSAGVSFRPLLIFLLALGALLALGKVLAEVRRRHWFIGVVLGYAVCATGIALVCLGIAGAFDVWPQPDPTRAAISLAIGAPLLEVTHTFIQPAHGRNLARRTVIWLTVIVGAFWATALHAQAIGTNLARGWASNAYARPQVIVHSVANLGLAGNGITREVTDAKTAYRYSGLRLLIYSNKKWFLLPNGGMDGHPSVVIILPDDDKVRIEIVRQASRP
jgi:hypothetical protein